MAEFTLSLSLFLFNQDAQVHPDPPGQGVGVSELVSGVDAKWSVRSIFIQLSQCYLVLVPHLNHNLT